MDDREASQVSGGDHFDISVVMMNGRNGCRRADAENVEKNWQLTILAILQNDLLLFSVSLA